MRAVKVVSWIIGLPIAAFFAVGLEISERMAPDETSARSAGISVSQCREIAMALGTLYNDADARCFKRQPKKAP